MCRVFFVPMQINIAFAVDIHQSLVRYYDQASTLAHGEKRYTHDAWVLMSLEQGETDVGFI